MTEPGNKVTTRTTAARDVLPAELAQQLQWLGRQPRPTAPPGAVGVLCDRVLAYAGPQHVASVLPVLRGSGSGLVVAGPRLGKPMPRAADFDYDGPIVLDPDAYGYHRATPDQPFLLPQDGFAGTNPTLDDVLDAHLRAGYAVACTPTGYIGAGDTAALHAAAQQVKALNRTDTLFVVALEVSLLDRTFFDQTRAILQDAGCPVALVLGIKQGDPLAHSRRIIPNLRLLAATVPLMPIRTDFNALDLMAHGAFAAAIGTGPARPGAAQAGQARHRRRGRSALPRAQPAQV